MLKAKALLWPNKEGNNNSLYLANLNRTYLGNNDKNIEIPNIKQITPLSDTFISERTTST